MLIFEGRNIGEIDEKLTQPYLEGGRIKLIRKIWDL